MRVTVFGSSAPKEGEPAWEQAFNIGKRLAEQKITVMTGGYAGTMEASSQGAATVEGAVIEGAICSPLFVTRKEQGNRFLTNIIDTPHLTDRLKALIDQSNAFIVLPGKLGTALELMLVWNISYIEGIFTPGSARKQIFAFREPWEKIVQVMTEQLDLDRNRDVPLVTFVDTVDEIMEKLAELQSKF